MSSPKAPTIEPPKPYVPPPPPSAPKTPQSTPVLKGDRRNQKKRPSNPLTINRPASTGLNVGGGGIGINVSR